MSIKTVRLIFLLLPFLLLQLSYSENFDPAKVKIFISRGWESVSQNDLDGGLAQFEKALEMDPANSDAILGKGRCLLYLNRLSEAEDAYKKILEKDPENQAAMLGLARAYNWQGNFDLAAEEYEKFLKFSLDDLEAKNELAQVNQWQGRLMGAQQLYEQTLLEDPRNSDALKGMEEIRSVLEPTQKWFVNYLGERDTGDFKSTTTFYGYRVTKPLASGNEIFGEYRLEDYRESGKGHAIGNTALLGGTRQVLEQLSLNGQLDLRDYSNDTEFFAGGLVNAVWNYHEKNSLTLQYQHDLFDVLDDVKADRYSAELKNFITQNLLMSNYYQFADLSDDNNFKHWQHSLTYIILKQRPDLSVSVGYRRRDFDLTTPDYYSPRYVGSIFYSIYLGKQLGKTYSYTSFRLYDNSDKIDSYSYLIGSEYTIKKDLSLGLEVNYFNTADNYRALGANLALHWKF